MAHAIPQHRQAARPEEFGAQQQHAVWQGCAPGWLGPRRAESGRSFRHHNIKMEQAVEVEPVPGAGGGGSGHGGDEAAEIRGEAAGPCSGEGLREESAEAAQGHAARLTPSRRTADRRSGRRAQGSGRRPPPPAFACGRGRKGGIGASRKGGGEFLGELSQRPWSLDLRRASRH